MNSFEAAARIFLPLITQRKSNIRLPPSKQISSRFRRSSDYFHHFSVNCSNFVISLSLYQPPALFAHPQNEEHRWCAKSRRVCMCVMFMIFIFFVCFLLIFQSQFLLPFFFLCLVSSEMGKDFYTDSTYHVLCFMLRTPTQMACDEISRFISSAFLLQWRSPQRSDSGRRCQSASLARKQAGNQLSITFFFIQ